MDTLLIVFASAGTAALVAGLMTIFGQYLERRARRQDLLLAKAVQIAAIRIDVLMKTADRNQQSASIPDLTYLTEKYYQALEHLMVKGRLPSHLLAEYDKAKDVLRARTEPDIRDGMRED